MPTRIIKVVIDADIPATCQQVKAEFSYVGKHFVLRIENSNGNQAGVRRLHYV